MRRLIFASLALGLCTQPNVHELHARNGAATSVVAPDHSDKVRRFESGLRPVYGVMGEPAQVWTLEERMRFHQVPGVSIAVAIDGEFVWAKAYGTADKADDRAVDTDTLFQAASLSKPVASLAALALVQDGLLLLDEPVNVHLKRWKIPENEFTREVPVTLRHLLSHRAGTNVHGFRGYAAGDTIATLPQILNGSGPANTDAITVSQRPGTAYRYSGGGYTIIQLAIEDAIDQTFAQVVEGRLFHPSGMTRSNFDYPPNDPNIAIGHRGENARSMNGALLNYPELAAAGLWTTPSELVRLGSLVAKARAFGNFILQTGLARQLIPENAENPGLGFGLNDAGDGIAFVHSGHNPGYSARWINYADGRASVAILTNSDNGGALIREMLSGLGHVYGWQQDAFEQREVARWDEAQLAEVAGEYFFDAEDDDPAVIVLRDGDALFIEGAIIDRARLYPRSASQLFVTQGLNLELERSASGAIAALNIEGEIRLLKG
ncbi:beta-lactamase family protein [Erythrobacter sp. SCSIO 43205]|uniref:serine hydrolase domain-containing protein n=1 Tax=Erythrobacter sp. SCSIO 43205 TaxID=2779361 RepID=UPI001CA95CEA|nr:serine hydrolase domain-containing protein [Erythrobacter sp. SCSIO 43205]UAB77788.1 beta-lactamase family protein [Erythrobacter sp. SCSIO 43205]